MNFGTSCLWAGQLLFVGVRSAVLDLVLGV